MRQYLTLLYRVWVQFQHLNLHKNHLNHETWPLFRLANSNRQPEGNYLHQLSEDNVSRRLLAEYGSGYGQLGLPGINMFKSAVYGRLTTTEQT